MDLRDDVSFYEGKNLADYLQKIDGVKTIKYLSKEEALAQGFRWEEDIQKTEGKETLQPKDLPDNIKEVSDSITDQIIECEHKGNCEEQCTQAFRIIPTELDFYRSINVPLPRLCPNCRHYNQLSNQLSYKLWPRTCDCELDNHDHAGKCEVSFETAYMPGKPEKIFCEKCYLKEIY